MFDLVPLARSGFRDLALAAERHLVEREFGQPFAQ
jgi:hypothetical protein